jgi:hypothetical protein
VAVVGKPQLHREPSQRPLAGDEPVERRGRTISNAVPPPSVGPGRERGAVQLTAATRTSGVSSSSCERRWTTPEF